MVTRYGVTGPLTAYLPFEPKGEEVVIVLELGDSAVVALTPLRESLGLTSARTNSALAQVRQATSLHARENTAITPARTVISLGG
jgi:hypothetical protein